MALGRVITAVEDFLDRVVWPWPPMPSQSHGQAGRAALFDGLIQRAETERS